MFNQYRIPKSYLLSKIGSVNEEGQYVSPIKDPRKRFGLFFILSACFMCCLWRGILNVYAFIALLRVLKVFFYNTLNFYNIVWNCFTQINYRTCNFNGYSVLLLLILWKTRFFYWAKLTWVSEASIIRLRKICVIAIATGSWQKSHSSSIMGKITVTVSKW